MLHLHSSETGREAFVSERQSISYLEEMNQTLRPAKAEFGVGFTEAVRVHEEALAWVSDFLALLPTTAHPEAA